MSTEVTSASAHEQSHDSRDTRESPSPETTRFEENLALWLELSEQCKRREEERMARVREKERQETMALHRRYIEEKQKKEQEKLQQQQQQPSSSRSMCNGQAGPPPSKQPRVSAVAVEEGSNTDWQQSMRSMEELVNNLITTTPTPQAEASSRKSINAQRKALAGKSVTHQFPRNPEASSFFAGFCSTQAGPPNPERQYAYPTPNTISMRPNQGYGNGGPSCDLPSSHPPIPSNPSTITSPILESVVSSSSSAEEQFETNIIQNIGTLPQLDGNLFEQEAEQGNQRKVASNAEQPMLFPGAMNVCHFRDPINLQHFAQFPQQMAGSLYSAYPSPYISQHPRYMPYPKRQDYVQGGFAQMPSQHPQQQVFLHHQQQQQQHIQMSQAHQTNNFAMNPQSQPAHLIYPEIPSYGYPPAFFNAQ